ncbi:response regulator [bacterium]|nr:response regulator [bacterium]
MLLGLGSALLLLVPDLILRALPSFRPTDAGESAPAAPVLESWGDATESSQSLITPLFAAVDTLEAGIFLLDKRWGFLYANQAVARMSGYRPEELTGLNFTRLRTGEPSDEVFEQIRMKMENREAWHGELVIRHQEGHLVALELVMTPLPLGPAGQQIYAGLQRDIVSRKRLEERKERYAHDLERIVAERTGELVKMNTRVQQESLRALEATQAKSRFLANMSHEIRTPLNAIIGFSDILLSEPLQAEQQEYLEIVSSSSRSLLELVNDILDFSRIEAGEMQLSLCPVSTKEQMKSCWLQFKQAASAKGIELTWEVEAGVPEQIESDSARLRQIMNNLVGNAIKFTENGFVRFGIHPGKNESLVIYVQDSGIGIDAKDQLTIFGAFRQGDDSTTRRFGGSGLGLAITRKLVRLLGGEITFTSVAGSGTTFLVNLPLHAVGEGLGSRVEEETPVTHKDSSSTTRSGLILIAEDNPHNYRLLESLLKKAGYDTLHAWNGQEALELFEQYERDTGLIVMDMKLPFMNGYDATAALRKRSTTVPIIAVTAYAMQDGVGGRNDRDRCLAAGCTDYLTKPLDLERFLALVDDYLAVPQAVV